MHADGQQNRRPFFRGFRRFLLDLVWSRSNKRERSVRSPQLIVRDQRGAPRRTCTLVVSPTAALAGHSHGDGRGRAPTPPSETGARGYGHLRGVGRGHVRRIRHRPRHRPPRPPLRRLLLRQGRSLTYVVSGAWSVCLCDLDHVDIRIRTRREIHSIPQPTTIPKLLSTSQDYLTFYASFNAAVAPARGASYTRTLTPF